MPALGRRIIQNMAEKTAIEAGYTTLPVCPVKIAEKHGIVVQAKPNAAKGCSGMLIRNGEQFGILYATHIPSEGFQRFSIGHELGHYFLEGHPEAVLKNGMHQSQAGFVTRDRYEQEADLFSASLLMPEDLLRVEMRKVTNGLSAIEALAKIAKTFADGNGISLFGADAGGGRCRDFGWTNDCVLLLLRKDQRVGRTWIDALAFWAANSERHADGEVQC